MEDNLLNRELLKRIFGNIGAVSGPKFGLAGITLPEFVVDKRIKTAHHNTTVSHDVYMAEISVEESKYRIALTNFETKDSPDFFMILKSSNEDVKSFSLFYDNIDFGNFAQKVDNKWIGLSLLNKLNLTIAFELITQNGLQWQPSGYQEDLFELLQLAGEVE